MKNYVAKLRENEEKGFSLVELIIVMAIMAILVGIVASQVIPYMEKSRQSKDQQQLSSLASTMVSAIAQNPDDFNQGNLTSDLTINVTKADDIKTALAGSDGKVGSSTCENVENTFVELMGGNSFFANYIGANQKKFTSKEAKDKLKTATNGIEFTLSKDGAVQVTIKGATSSKLKVKSE